LGLVPRDRHPHQERTEEIVGVSGELKNQQELLAALIL
jgi:hypothetical protein